MIIFFILLALFALTATTVKLIKKDVWWIRMFDFPQAQITFLAFIALAGFIVYWEWGEWYKYVFVILLTAAIIYQLTIIIPYTLFYPVQTKKANLQHVNHNNILSLMVVNVYQFNKKYDKCLKVVKDRDADIVLAVETDKKWQKAFDVLQEDHKYTCKIPLDNTYGMLLYSKLELVDTELKFLIEKNVPSIHTKLKLRSGQEVKLYCVHPEPPSPTENKRSTERDAELLLVGKNARKEDLPVIVAGDLNDVAWSHTTTLFQRMSGLLDPRIGRGFYNTFHAKYPVFRWPLDHIFHSDHFELIKIQRLGPTGSDHFPMYVQLYCNFEYKKEQEIPEPDESDIEQSKEKIEKAAKDSERLNTSSSD
ncbi:MAG: endonuclease/exonuclease/phosphatase family protein [Candidatus Cyclobacteriaceae bacterium M2_1C_046]